MAGQTKRRCSDSPKPGLWERKSWLLSPGANRFSCERELVSPRVLTQIRTLKNQDRRLRADERLESAKPSRFSVSVGKPFRKSPGIPGLSSGDRTLANWRQCVA